MAPSAPAPDKTQLTKKVAGKTAVITGGSQGCGRALARLFAAEGFNVVVAARQPERLSAAAEELSALATQARADSLCLAVPTDVTSADDVARLAAQVVERFESVDCVVNNAGVCLRGSLEATSEQDFRDQMNVNFMGPMLVSRAFEGQLKQAARQHAQQGGGGPKPTLLYVNSFAGRLPLKGMAAYTASKYALAGFADAVRAELAADGVAVTQVHPGVVKSDFMERAQFRGTTADADNEKMAEMLASGGGGVVQTPEQVAAACLAAYKKGKREVVVGAPFRLFVWLFNVFGFNIMAR